LVCLSVCRSKDVDNFVSISNILFSFLVNLVTNCSFLSKIIFSGNLYNFYILFLNNFANSSVVVSFVIVIKYVILSNLSYTVKIISFLTTNSNFVIKSIIKYIYSFSSTSFAINFLYIFLYLLLFLTTSNFLSLTLLSSISFYILLLAYHSITELFPLSISHPLVYILLQNKLLTYLWYLNLRYTLRGLKVIQKFNNNDNDNED